jgi:hypothetical protein
LIWIQRAATWPRASSKLSSTTAWAGVAEPSVRQPYIAEFVSKLCDEYRTGNVESAILLTHNYTDTAWFHEAAGTADAICFTRGRVRFLDAEGKEVAPTQGQAFFYFGPDVPPFAEPFAQLGFVVVLLTAQS